MTNSIDSIIIDNTFIQEDGIVKDSEGNEIQDIVKLTEGTGNCSLLTFISSSLSIAIPNDFEDRLNICYTMTSISDLMDRMADLINKVNIAIPSMVSDPSVTSDIITLKQDINTLNNNVNTLKDNLK